MTQSTLHGVLSLINLPPWTPYESKDSTRGAQRKKRAIPDKTYRKNLYYPNNMP